MSVSLCKEAEIRTRDQNNNILWYKLRYDRITASKLYEAAHCKISDGSLVRTVIGAAKVFDTQEMQRGRILKKQILEEAMKQVKNSYRYSSYSSQVILFLEHLMANAVTLFVRLNVPQVLRGLKIFCLMERLVQNIKLKLIYKCFLLA